MLIHKANSRSEKHKQNSKIRDSQKHTTFTKDKVVVFTVWSSVSCKNKVKKVTTVDRDTIFIFF